MQKKELGLFLHSVGIAGHNWAAERDGLCA